ncbi:MAG: hypothetical protein QXM09_05745 [Candidatus Methanomethylicaceae archaeon]
MIVEDKRTSYLSKQMFKLYATDQYSLGALAEELGKRGLKIKRGELLSPEEKKKIYKTNSTLARW